MCSCCTPLPMFGFRFRSNTPSPRNSDDNWGNKGSCWAVRNGYRGVIQQVYGGLFAIEGLVEQDAGTRITLGEVFLLISNERPVNGTKLPNHNTAAGRDGDSEEESLDCVLG